MGSVLEITVEDLAKKLDDGEPLVLLDVRQPSEHAICSLPGAVLIPLHELPSRTDELDPDRETVVYCHHGVRSLSGVVLLQRAGFANVASLKGGIDAWSKRIDPKVRRY